MSAYFIGIITIGISASQSWSLLLVLICLQAMFGILTAKRRFPDVLITMLCSLGYGNLKETAETSGYYQVPTVGLGAVFREDL